MTQMSFNLMMAIRHALEVELAEELDAKIKAFERYTGIAIAEIHVDITSFCTLYGNDKPVHCVTKVTTKLDI